MKVYKIAQSGGTVPLGHIRIKITTNMEGEKETRIIGRGADTSCNTEDDPQLIQDYLDAEVPGFGEEGLLINLGSTPEAWEGKKKVPLPTITQPGPFGEEGLTVETPRESQPDLGYGV